MANRILTANLSEPLDGAKTAKIDVESDTGHLTIDSLAGAQVLASGTLQYFEKQGIPAQTTSTSEGQATLTVKGGGRAAASWFRFPWEACGGAYEWLIHLNATVPSDLTAHTGGGNVKLDLSRMQITRLAADSGGGNLSIALPDTARELSILARTGGGNVTVELGASTTGRSVLDASSGAGNVVIGVPNGIAARIQATSGLGKVAVDPRFGQVDKNTYQSSDYETAADKVDITAKSGAGNVVVRIR